MFRYSILSVMFLCYFNAVIYAQQPYTFTETACNSEYIASDGTIFLANYFDGLRGYSFGRLLTKPSACPAKRSRFSYEKVLLHEKPDD